MASSSTPPWQRVIERGGLAVLLIRHGRTPLNAAHRFCGGRSDPPLDDEGRRQAAELAARLAEAPIERVFSSPQLRARETAAALGRELTLLEGLRELDQGELEGREIHPALNEHAEFFRKWKRDPTYIAVPGGENMDQLALRTMAAMDGLLDVLDARPRVRRAQLVAVVGHQMAHGAFVCRALAKPLREWQQFALRNATANLMAWDGRNWSLMARNL